FYVIHMEPERSLVFGPPELIGLKPDPSHPAMQDMDFRSTWAFALHPIGNDATELDVRVRAAWEPSFKMSVTSRLIGAAHEIMDRAQLRTLEKRVGARS